MLKHPQNTPSDQSPQTRKVRLVGPVRLVGVGVGSLPRRGCFLSNRGFPPWRNPRTNRQILTTYRGAVAFSSSVKTITQRPPRHPETRVEKATAPR